ncbi:flavin-containing amine oxidoreductase-domain containing protein [Dipodascopsis tothii]|uniref:flavin-containing amine oxidoreductase-domain containing protein n=1 Tax=Dipodascopsis tothii TaxID=44089 RepID=UPI0034CD17EF
MLASMLAETDYVDPPIYRSQIAAAAAAAPPPTYKEPYNRLEYFAKLSIPSNKTSREYAKEGVDAAVASRLPPFALHPGEYKLLRKDINHLHVTTYLSIRNGILRLWRMNHLVSVTRPEAAGCAKDPRFFGLAEAAFEWLVRNGYINFGCIEIPRCRNNLPYVRALPETKQPRLRIVIVGAGMAGLACARQLEGLFRQYDDFMMHYEDLPEIILIEGRSRIGGRVYSAPLHSAPAHKVDLGGQIVTGFANGNPISVLACKQMGLTPHYLKDASVIYDEVEGGPVDRTLDLRAESLFNDMLDRTSAFKKHVPQPHSVEGDPNLILAGLDPTGEGGRTIAKMEENAVTLPPLERPADDRSGGAGRARSFGRLHQGRQEKTALPAKLGSLGFEIPPHKRAAASLPADRYELPPATGQPSLGQALDAQLSLCRQLVDLSPLDMRLVNWHYANLEYANATCVNNLSLGSWDQDDGNEFAGRHAMIKDGYAQVPRALYLFPQRLDVRFRSPTTEIAFHADRAGAGQRPFDVKIANGSLIQADRVVCTVPLGVLKAGRVAFAPPLPEAKTASIRKLGFGVLNKVVLVYDRVFWDPSKDIVGVTRCPAGDSLNQTDYTARRGKFYMFWNTSAVVGKPCLVALLAGEAAFESSERPDDAFVHEVSGVLARMFPRQRIPPPVESIVTRWHRDPFAYGSYSYVGPEADGDDYDNLAAPLHGGRLAFAGEGTSRTHPATVHGAYLSGLRAAAEIFESVVGDIELPAPLIQPKVRTGQIVPRPIILPSSRFQYVTADVVPPVGGLPPMPLQAASGQKRKR